MSRRAKLILASLFLVLLGIPVAYIALTWHVADPFRFRYVGHGEVEMRPAHPFMTGGAGTEMQTTDPFFTGGKGKEIPMVPIYIELQNTTSVPISLIDGDVRGKLDRAGPPCARIEWRRGPIPRHGTVRLVSYVPVANLQRLESESLDVSYLSVSGTQSTAYDLDRWLREKLFLPFHIDINLIPSSVDASVTPLLKAPAHPPEASPAASTQQP
ncbi:hypothetical protein [Roseimicrobium sp. ORNL1]|uniref:hypothetical protein n=1 Tax=Roseimicrobium sp. ORNL1 TaxID=2711231 RepID=UPI0013E1EFCB|nr:hypothetical protein [Roseimicrobium sp. ORNL1]QIF01981.1 hypothetical protein G5S37_10710 [Roseimicrobium sp. ORNL1]